MVGAVWDQSAKPAVGAFEISKKCKTPVGCHMGLTKMRMNDPQENNDF